MKKYLVIIMIALIAYYALFLPRELLIRSDSAKYLMLGRSLAAGTGYIDYYSPQPKINTLCFPGYPFLLSIAIRMLGDNILLLRAFMVAMSGLCLVVLIGILRRYLEGKELLFVFLLFGLSPLFIAFTNMFATEVPYMLFSWLAILILNKERKLTHSTTLRVNPESLDFARDGALVEPQAPTFKAESVEGLTWAMVLAAALAMIIGFYIRPVGIILYVSLIIYLLMRRENKYILPLVLLLGLSVLPWVIRVAMSDCGYHTTFMFKDPYNFSLGIITSSDMLVRILSNIKYYIGKVAADLIFFPCFKEITFGSVIFPVKIFLSFTFSLLFITAFFSYVRHKGIGIAEIYVLIYSISLIFWTYHDERFFIPIYPFLISYLLIFLRRPKMRLVGNIIIFALLAGLILGNIKALKELARGERGKSFFETMAWLRANMPPDAAIMSQDPAGTYLYSERKGIFLTRQSNITDTINAIKKNGISYVIIGEGGLTNAGRKQSDVDIWLKPILEQYPGCLSVIYESSHEPKVFVYKIENNNSIASFSHE